MVIMVYLIGRFVSTGLHHFVSVSPIKIAFFSSTVIPAARWVKQDPLGNVTQL